MYQASVIISHGSDTSLNTLIQVSNQQVLHLSIKHPIIKQQKTLLLTLHTKQRKGSQP